jgi:hypothetical protein
VSFAAVPAGAQEYMPPTSTPPADYEVQGEYVGTTANGAKVGAWLISRGSMRFDVVLLPGGLLALTPNDPNGGWNGTSRFSASNVTLSGTTFSATLTGGYVLTSITGTGIARVLNGTANGSAFALNRVTGALGIGGPRQSPTLGLRPEGQPWSTGYQSWFNSATATADLTKWAARDNAVQLKYGNYLFRGIVSTATMGTCFMHIEFRTAFVPTGTGQSRGNSGIYMRGMHEVQVLDSFGLTGAINEYGSVYNIRAPLVNASLPPLTWHTYDIYYTAGSGTNGTFTVYANGVLVQNGTTVSVVTEAGFNGTTLYTQNHGNEVIYNNVWMIPNATTTTLPYSTVNPASVGLNPHAIRPWGNTRAGSKSFFDLLGRKALRNPESRIAILPIGHDR